MILLQADSTVIISNSASIWMDYGEYIVGIPTFIASTIVAFWIYKKQINKKGLTYSIKNATRLVNIKSTFKNRFDILFDKQKVEDLSLLTIEFINSGNQPIKREDYETDIEIELNQTLNRNIRVLSFDIVEREPSNIKNEINGTNTHFKISPSLLNPNDKFKLQFLVDFEDVKDITIDVKARIVGINALKRLKEEDKSPYEKIIRELLMSLVGLIISIIISVLSASAIIQEILQKFFGK